MKVLKKLLKGAFWLCIVVLFALIILGLVYMLDWPIWSWVLVAAGFAAAGLAGFWGYKVWIRRREGHFVNEIISQDEDSASEAVPSEKDRQRALRTKWQEAVEVLRHSHLKKYGNPLYVLPWYMVIGESGTGKTTAIRNAQLSSPFASPSPTAGPGSTADCDWWFFDQAIILDMAGRYSMGTEEDRTEWNSFVRLIARYRRREPINGLIVSISAESQENLEKAAKDADLIIFSTPVYEILRLGEEVKRYITSRNVVVTDTGSTKSLIVKKLSKIYPCYIGSHPLAGSEKKGCNFSSADLFQNKIAVLTPLKDYRKDVIKKIKRFALLSSRTK